MSGSTGSGDDHADSAVHSSACIFDHEVKCPVCADDFLFVLDAELRQNLFSAGHDIVVADRSHDD